MSTDKDKRSSKIFGTRISSIFNSPQSHSRHSSASSGNIPHATPKPLSQPPMLNKTGTSQANMGERRKQEVPRLPVSHPPTPARQTQAAPVRSPPKRKPPPPLMQSLDFERTTQEGGQAQTAMPHIPAHQYSKEVKEDLNDIIGTLEKEIDNMLVTDKPSTQAFAGNYPTEQDETMNRQVLSTLEPSKSHQSEVSAFSGYSKASQPISNNLSLPFGNEHSIISSDSPRSSISTPSYPPIEGSQMLYPMDGTSPSFANDMALGTSVPENTYMNQNSNQSLTSISSSIYSQNAVGDPILLQKSVDTQGSAQSIPFQRQKEYPVVLPQTNKINNSNPNVRPLSNSSISRQQNGLAQNRNVMKPNNAPQESYNEMPSRAKPPVGRSEGTGHRKSNSQTSIWSSNSYRNVNLAVLKKNLNLKAGEGERSNYVSTIRRNAGTAYNESPPAKWKLPTGILPIDKNASHASNGRYMRLAGGVSQARNKNISGVELKHGHLQPRLLAAEVDDGDDDATVGLPSKSNASGTDISVSTGKSPANGIKSSSSSINVGPSSLHQTLGRTESFAKTDDSRSIAGDSISTIPSSKRTNSVVSSSSGSIVDFGGAGGYYQHPGYLYNDDDDESTEVDSQKFSQRFENDDEYDDYGSKPRLVLANPDNSDSD